MEALSMTSSSRSLHTLSMMFSGVSLDVCLEEVETLLIPSSALHLLGWAAQGAPPGRGDALA